MQFKIDITKDKYEIIKDENDNIGNEFFSNSRLEVFGYFDKHNRILCNLINIVDKDYNTIKANIIGHNENYQKHFFRYISTFEYIDYSNIMYDYRPPLIYNFDLVVKGIKRNKNIYIVEDERFANYLCNKNFIATTILNGLDRDIDIRFLKAFKNANIYFIGHDFLSNIDKKLKNIANKVIILDKAVDYKKEFGKNSELLKAVKEYDSYLNTLKEKDLLVDSNIYNLYKNEKEPFTINN